jgi:23S rRNA-/tRNA-specific pseudouridylate synthase
MPERYAATPGRLDVEGEGSKRAGASSARDRRRSCHGRRVARAKSFRLLGDEKLLVDLAIDRSLVPDPRPVPVRYRDEHLAVVAKPTGVVTHPTATHRRARS